MMHSLASCLISDMTECASELRKLGAGASSVQDVAQRIASYLYLQLGNDRTGRQDCALVRCFLTRAYRELDPQSQDCARRALACGPGSLDMKCLTLLGTAGERPEWNDRNRSRRYRSIPLADREVISQFPMVSQLLQQLGVDFTSKIQPKSDLAVDQTEHTLDVFHVAEAKGSPFLPAQEEFVIPFGIESVLGFGGVFPSTAFFTVILFSKQKDLPRDDRIVQAAGAECQISPVALRWKQLETFDQPNGELAGSVPGLGQGARADSLAPEPHPFGTGRGECREKKVKVKSGEILLRAQP